MGDLHFLNFFVAICSTLTVATANPLITPIELHKFDYNPSSKPLIFNNEDNLSRLNCGKLENIVTTRGKHFPWDAQVKIGDRTCAAIFISPKAILTSATCFETNSNDKIIVKTENGREIETNTSLVRLFGDHSTFSFAIVNLPISEKNVTPICLWNFGPKTAAYGQHLQYKVISLEKKRLKIPVNIENPAMCYAYASTISKEKLNQGKILCTVLENSKCTKVSAHFQQEGFLIKRLHKRWFLRGIPLREPVVGSKKVNTFNNIFPQLRWIAENAEKIFALPAVAPPAEPYIFNGEAENLSSPKCGLVNDKAENSAFQVYSGTTSVKEAHPWHAHVNVTIDEDLSKLCGGTLIKENVVLTAAHCVKIENKVMKPNQVIVTLGVHDSDENGTRNIYRQRMEPKFVIVHPKYEGYKNDIALLIFENDFNRNDRVSTLCLWNRGGDLDSIVNTMGTVVGFGSTSNVDDESSLPTELQKADLPVLSYEKCFQTGNSLTFARNLMPGENFCAGYKNGTTTCGGDSGGSFAIKVDGRWFTRGITSFGSMKSESHCEDNYAVFLDVAKYIPWIMEKVLESQAQLSEKGLFSCISNSIRSFFG